MKLSIVIEDDVMIGSGVHIYVNNHKFDDITIPIIDQGYYPDLPVILKKGCWIGANTIILPGVTIGENSVVGAGSVVTKSIPKNVVAVGNPAKVLKSIL
ncbi:DapH/DapD/GlmU-related protein [Sphingobacterium sp.]|nr:DapH/DapD/GlmU-related protein [Sphingobacterium sp.]